MKHLFNLLAILMICSYSAHCFGQDEVLIYDFTGWCNKDHSINRVPYGVGSYGMMEIHFKNKGKELQCSIRMGEEFSMVYFDYVKTDEIKVAIGDSGLDYDLKVVEYWEKDQKGSFKDVIRLSLDRKKLYHYVDLISKSYVGYNEYEYKYAQQNPKEFRLIEDKAEEEELPAWMK